MSEQQMGITEFRARLTELLRRVQDQGDCFVVTDRGRPVARLQALAAPHDEPAPAPARLQFAPEVRRSIFAAARHMTPIAFNERTMEATYRFIEDGGTEERKTYLMDFVVCPTCFGRGRVVRTDLDGQPVPQEVVNVDMEGFAFLDVCGFCGGDRVVAVPDPNQMGWERHYLEYRSWEIERLQAEIWPFLHASKELDAPHVNPVPPTRPCDDVPF